VARGKEKLDMKKDALKIIVELRILVGYLGEKEQYEWWDSTFFSKSAPSFLNPVYPRTQLRAQCNGVTAAATAVHDNRIGVGNVFHLFRLPEGIESEVNGRLSAKEAVESLGDSIVSATEALSRLQSHAADGANGAEGPLAVGTIKELESGKALGQLAAAYASAFKQGTQAFPYVTGN
jgi:hypothetical protein